MRWPRKNDAASIEARREAMGLGDGLVTSVDLEPFAGAAESLVGVAVIPVSAVPLEIELGAYELDDDGARRRDRPRGRDRARAARAHRGRPDGVDDARRARRRRRSAPTCSHDRITRASCFVCANAGRGDRTRALGRGRAARDARVARVVGRPVALAAREAARRQDARRRADVPRALAVDDRRRRRAEHDDAQLATR